jgi:hypothetical protein
MPPLLLTSKHSAASTREMLPSGLIFQRCEALPLGAASATGLPFLTSLQSSTRCVVASVMTPVALIENSCP